MTLPLAAPFARLWRSDRFAALQGREYRRFWWAALSNDVANWLLFAAQGWLLIELSRGPEVVVLFFVLRIAPKVLFSLPAGALCDRYGALRVLRWARLAGAAPSLLIGIAAAAGRLSVDMVLISAVLTAVVQAFDQPGHRTLLHAYAPGRLLVGGLALNATAATLSTLAGPLLLTPVAATSSLLWIFPVQAALVLVSGAILLGNLPMRIAACARDASVGRDCWTVLRYLASTPAIIVLVLLAGSPGMLDRLLTMVTPEYAGGHHGSGAAGLTLFFLAPATGALLGGSALAWIGGEVRRLLPLALGSSSVAMISVGLLATTKLFLLSLLLFLILGAAKAAFSIAIMAALQRRVPDHARGRVLAL